MLRFTSLFAAAILCSPLAMAGQNASSSQASPQRPVAQVRYQPQAVPLETQRKLNDAIGRTVYACYRTGLILLDTEEHDGKPVLYYGAPADADHVAYMAPWKVIGIDRLNDDAGWSSFGLRLLVNGSAMVMNGIVVSPSELQSSPDILQTLTEKAGLFPSIEASGIRFTDLNAVQRREIHPGMSEQEVACALGSAEQSDAEGAGRLKNIYDGGRLVIDLAGGSVVDVRRPTPRQLAARAAE